MKLASLSMILLGAVLFSSCGGGGGGNGGDSGGGGGDVSFQTVTLNASSDAGGRVNFSFLVPAGSTAFQVAAEADGLNIDIIALTDPTGASILSQPAERSDATESPVSVNVFNYPTLTDGLKSGTYNVSYLLSQGRDFPAGVGVKLSVTTKSDADIANGTLPVNIALIGPVADATELVEDIEAAVEFWREDFSRAGIALDVQFYSFDGPGLLPDPRRGDPFYRAVTRATRPGAVTIAIGRDVSGVSGDRDLRFAVPGGIPSAAVAGLRSVGALSIEEVTGGDGLFDSNEDESNQLGDSEVRLAGEEMAQLAGHFLGLQHPVDFDGDKAEQADRIGDTASCLELDDCRAENQPRDNFMFSRVFKIPGEGNKFYARDDITPGQAALMHRNVIMR